MFEKSPERISLEAEIDAAHAKAFAVAVQMVHDEHNGDFEAALADSNFVMRVQGTVAAEWEKYQRGYEQLEALEIQEQFPAMRHIAQELDVLSHQVPLQCRSLCYYPFSGVDFYWARVFRTLVCEDIGFDMPQMPNMWWRAATYNKTRRDEIIALLKKECVIPHDSDIVCVSRDAKEAQKDEGLNNPHTTLLVKGGHDILGFFEERFPDKLKFGTIITVSSANSLPEMESVLSRQRYTLKHSAHSGGFLVPYAMELRDIHVFTRQE